MNTLENAMKNLNSKWAFRIRFLTITLSAVHP